MNDILFSVLINLYQGILMIWFMKKRLIQTIHPMIYDCAFMAAVGGALCLWEFAGLEINDNLIFLLPLTYALLFSDEKWYYPLFWTLVLCAGFLVSENINLQLFQLGKYTLDELYRQSSIRTALVLSANVIITLVLTVLANIRIHSNALSAGAIACFLLTLFTECVVSEALFVLQFQLDPDSPVLLFASLGMLPVMLLTIILYEMLSVVSAQKHLSDMKMRLAQMAQSHREELTTVYTGMLAAQHDLKHRITAAEQLLKASPDEETRRKAAELLKDKDVLNEYLTGNVTVDAILTAKQNTMRKNGIRFHFSYCPLTALPIEEQDFCVLLSNMLDNAIEGAMRIRGNSSPREIKLTFARTWDMFSIICENTADAAAIRQRHGRFLSSKEDPGIHGFGTQSMRQITEAAGGNISFKTIGNSFVVEILLPEAEKRP